MKSTKKKKSSFSHLKRGRSSLLFKFTKTLNKDQIETSRLYIPAPFSRAMIRTTPGISHLWNVIVTPTHPFNLNLKVQLLPSEGKVEFKLGGDWQFFCKLYNLKPGTEITMEINSVEQKHLHVELNLPTTRK